LYDPDCGLCRATTGAVLSWDRRRRLRPVALGTAEAERALARMPEERRWDSWHLVDEQGRVSSAGAGFAPLLRRLPGGGPLAGLPERFPGAAERAYRLVADNRSRIGPLIPAALKSRADRVIEHRSGGRS